jgi:WD40 repeat protein
MASDARKIAARRRAHEHQAPVLQPAPGPAWSAAWREVQAILDEEIERLPAVYREAFVLCCLENQQCAEVARSLGQKEGTVWSRVARARKLLQERLARRGVTLAGVLGAAAVSGNTSLAGMPRALVESTVEAAVQPATDLVSPTVAALVSSAMKAVGMGRARALLVVLAAGVVVVGLGLAAAQQDAAGPPPANPARAAKVPRMDRHGDPLPPAAQMRLGSARLRHGGMGGGLVTFAPDGRVLISVHGDGVIHFWAPATGKELRQVRTGYSCFGPGPAALSAGGTLAAFPVGNFLSVWDLKAGKELHNIGHGTPEAPCITLSADGKRAATGSTDGARLWEVSTGKEICSFTGHRAAVTALALSPDGACLASKGADGTVIVWTSASGKKLFRARAEPGSQSDLAWSSDGKMLALVQGKAIILYDASTGREVRQIERPQYSHSLAFSPDGETLAVAALGGIHFWQTGTGKPLRKIDLGDLAAGNLAFSPDGKILAATGTGSMVRLWQVATGKELHEPEGHRGGIRCVCFSPDGQRLATAGDGSTIRLWDVKTGRQVGTCPGRRQSFLRVLFSADGKNLFAQVPTSPIQEWDATTGKQRRLLEVKTARPGRRELIRTIALAPGGKSLTAISQGVWGRDEEWALVTWGLRGLEPRVTVLAPPKRPAWPPVLAPDGSLFARFDGPAIQVCETVAGKERFTLTVPGDTVVNGAFAPDNATLATVCLCRDANRAKTMTLVIWELVTGQEIRRYDLGRLRASYGAPLAFSADGRFLAGGGENDSPTRLWDLATGKELLRLEGQREVVTSLAFSPDGKRLASGLRNGLALVWATPSAVHRPRVPGPRLSARRLEELWADLAQDSPVKAQAARWGLIDAGAQVVALLKEHIRPVAAVKASELARLIAELDSDRFATREAASRELMKLGPQAESALRKVLAGRPTAEMRRRVKALLAQPGLAGSAETARRLRGIQVLEAMGSKEARQVLEALAQGAAAARETQAAKAALERVGGLGR